MNVSIIAAALCIGCLAAGVHAEQADAHGAAAEGETGRRGTIVREDIRQELVSYRDEAVQWLLLQKVPNDMVESPVPWRRNLLVSYRIPEEDPAYPYLRGRSYLYDDALAAIAFTMTGRLEEAEDVLLAMSRQLRPDGSLWFGVNLHNEWPSEEGHGGATVRSGASAWAGYAAAYYLRSRTSSEPDFGLDDRIARQILSFAEGTAGRLIGLQVTERADPRFGLVTGGMGSYSFSVNDEGEVVSSYTDERIGWVSAEHNIDAYFLFAELAELTADERYRRAAGMVEEGMMNLWDGQAEQFIQGIKEEGRRDDVLPLDTASWGSMFLRAAGREEMADAALEAGGRRFALGKADYEGDHSGGYRPYAADAVYLEDEVSEVYFGDPDITWNELDIAWPEGSLGMAVALDKGGRTGEAIEVIRAAAGISTDGGIHYATMEVPHQFSIYPSVAGTAWLVIAIEHLLDAEDAALFWR